MDWIVEGGEDCGTEGIQGPQKTKGVRRGRRPWENKLRAYLFLVGAL